MLEKLAVVAVGALDVVVSLRRPVRRWMVFILDGLLCLLAAWIAFALRLGEWPDDVEVALGFAATAFIFWAPFAWLAGVYRNLIRFSGAGALRRLCYACTSLMVPLIVIFTLMQTSGVPRTLAILHSIIFFLLLLFSRLSMRFIVSDLLHAARGQSVEQRRLLIYGAGRGGQQLANSLRQEPHLVLVGYIDDDERLNGQQVDGVPVWHSSSLQRVLEEREVDEVLLAMPSAPIVRKREIVATLQKSRIRVRTLPGMGQLIDGNVAVSHLRDVQIEDLLGRDPIAPHEILMGRSLVAKVVMVTGAGGSIGSELCRQIIRSRPRRLILVEQSEFSLASAVVV